MNVARRFRGILTVGLFLLAIVSTATAKYSGGSGTAQDPYQIATAADLILLGSSSLDYEKHFILTADIDLDPKLPGRKVFDKAVVAPDLDPVNYDFQGPPFTGVLDGNSHAIQHLTINGSDYLGLFGQLADRAVVRNLGIVDVKMTGPTSSGAGRVGALAGWTNGCTVAQCYSTGNVSGRTCVGGLVGWCLGTVTQCHSTATVSGTGEYSVVGGLVGEVIDAVTLCYSTGAVKGTGDVGGLVGQNWGGTVTQCYSTGAVSGVGTGGTSFVGGLVGHSEGAVTQCYSTGKVSGGTYVGGLIGGGDATACFWDAQTSGQTKSPGGLGKTTAQMWAMQTYIDAGWDFVGEIENGTQEVWQMPQGGGYPILAVFNGYTAPHLQGTGAAESPYLIHDALELGAIVHYSFDAHYRLEASIDLRGIRWGVPVIAVFAGTFDGNGYTISHLTIQGAGNLGLFGELSSGADVRDLGVVDVNVTGFGGCVAGLVGGNGGTVRRCYSTGVVSATGNSLDVGGLVGGNGGTVAECHSTATVSATGEYPSVGGLVGQNWGDVTQCYSAGAVSGTGTGGFLFVGGLVGDNMYGTVIQCYSTGDVSGVGTFGCPSIGGLAGSNSYGTVIRCYSTGAVGGVGAIGGLLGQNGGMVTECFSTGAASSKATYAAVGGLVGSNGYQDVVGDRVVDGCVSACYSTAAVSSAGKSSTVGGLVGDNRYGIVVQCHSTGAVGSTGEGSRVGGLVGGYAGSVTASFWDTQTSGQITSVGGTGKTTAQMQTAKTFLDAAWDFVGETTNGTADFWQMSPKGGYPVFAVFSGYAPPQLRGGGTSEDPYLVHDAVELGAMAHYNPDACYRLAGSIDLSGIRWGLAVIPHFAGTFDGNGHTISHLTIQGAGNLGLFGRLAAGAEVKNLGVTDVNIADSADWVGGLAGSNAGTVTQCYSTGKVSSGAGLVGWNHYSGTVTQCYSTATVSGGGGGLVASNGGTVAQCYSTGKVSGGAGLVWWNDYSGTVTQCYATGVVSGTGIVGGLVGGNGGIVTQCYSTGAVRGTGSVGGLVGSNWGTVTTCFWDMQTSGRATSDGGKGKTTAEMEMAKTFLDAGWDFVGETKNRTEDIWWILEGKDCPRLVWERGSARLRSPEDSALDVAQPLILRWGPGGIAMQHDVYLGEDEHGVASAATGTAGVYRGRQSAEATAYDPGILPWGRTYYWRIDEVNPDEADNAWKGSVWSFSTSDLPVVVVLDDFESYTDDERAGQTIWQTWIDGFADNFKSSSSTVGNFNAPFAEQKIVHGGKQSMPMDYNNVNKPWYSEAQRTWATPQDWTTQGADTLTLYFRGKADNRPDWLYVGIQDSAGRIAIVVHPDAGAVLATEWQKWHIALAEVRVAGVNVAAVKKMVIGVGDRQNPKPGGTGRIYIDDIRLTKRMP